MTTEPIMCPLRAWHPIPGGWRGLPVTVFYDPADPYAITWRLDGREWLCSRELLDQGLTEPTDPGRDVVIVPRVDAVDVGFASPDGAIAVRFRARDLQAFLDKTTALVPLGAEIVDWDAEMARLGGAA